MANSVALTSVNFLTYSLITKPSKSIKTFASRSSSSVFRVRAVQENEGRRRLVDIIRIIPEASRNYFKRPSRRALFGGVNDVIAAVLCVLITEYITRFYYSRPKVTFTMRSTIDRYKKTTANSSTAYTTEEINAQFYQQESKKLHQQIQMLQNSNRHLMGEGLSSLNVKELKQLETRLERGITKIRGKKHEMILAETDHLQKREIQLEQENACLRSKIQDNEKLQELSMMPSGQDFAFQAYFARNVLQLNMMEPISPYPVPDKKTLHLGY
ncbi:Agamous-like MADS-box protein agl11 [Castilleja foliolosa]|uniref:Agamous-like MADS-box protein agl11 n=1 Tax=Castilleja foliolosa TaxID=1961234 RepID=A0ABD3BNM5_9LAMI